MSLSTITELLSSYNGRDKLLRTISYSSLLLSGVIKSKNIGSKFEIISGQISSCRSILRLFDDIPMLTYTLSYGLGRHETDKLLRVLGVFTNAVDQIYYPIEHVAWAADKNLFELKGGSGPWWLASTICWCLSLYLSLLRSLRKLSLLSTQRRQCEADLVRQASLRAEQHAVLLAAAQSLFDLGHAVHWLPKGVLWAGTMQPWQRGLLGSLSSFISLYRTIIAL